MNKTLIIIQISSKAREENYHNIDKEKKTIRRFELKIR